MNNVIVKNEVVIEDLIYEIRGKQVMLDSDLTKLYKCANGTKTLNLAVKRHINRFPERFMFQLTDDEYKKLRFQFETSSIYKHTYTPQYTCSEECQTVNLDCGKCSGFVGR